MRQYIFALVLGLIPYFAFAAPKVGVCSLMLDSKSRRDLGYLIVSARDHFCPQLGVQFHVFTHKALKVDAPDITFHAFGDIYAVGICHHEYETLVFLRALLEKQQELQEYDYLFVIHPSLRIVNPVTEEQLGTSVAALHPYYSTLKPFIEDEESHLYQTEGEYFSPAFFGGTPQQVFEMCDAVIRLVQADIERAYYIAPVGLCAYLNRYFLDNPPQKLLSADSILCRQNYYRKQRRLHPIPQVLAL